MSVFITWYFDMLHVTCHQAGLVQVGPRNCPGKEPEQINFAKITIQELRKKLMMLLVIVVLVVSGGVGDWWRLRVVVLVSGGAGV